VRKELDITTDFSDSQNFHIDKNLTFVVCSAKCCKKRLYVLQRVIILSKNKKIWSMGSKTIALAS